MPVHHVQYVWKGKRKIPLARIREVRIEAAFQSGGEAEARPRTLEVLPDTVRAGGPGCRVSAWFDSGAAVA